MKTNFCFLIWYIFVFYVIIFYFRSSAYDFRLMTNLDNIYLTNVELSNKFNQLENDQPNIAEFQAQGESLISVDIHSLKVTHNVSISFKTYITIYSKFYVLRL